MNIEDEIRQIISSAVELPVEEVRLNASLRADLGADSLDMVTIIVDCEHKFDVTLPDSAELEVKTVQDVVNMVESQMALLHK